MVDTQTVTVLVADDGHEHREFVVDSILVPQGFKPLLARDGVEAMEMVRQHQPDIILLDLQMPRMDGIEVLDALKEEGWDIPVILMTFHGSEEIAIEVFRKGVRNYLVKPYTIDEMEEAIQDALSEVRMRREKEALTERLLQANRSLNRRIRDLKTLYQMGKSVTALVGMDQLLCRVVDAAAEVSGAQQGSALLLEGDQLVCRASKPAGVPNAQPVNEFSSDSMAWRAVRSGNPVVLSPQELNEQRARNPMLPAAVACVPLKVGRRVVGVLSVENVTPNARAFTNQDGVMLSALGDYAAIAIENARIYTELQEATRRERDSLRDMFTRYVAPNVAERLLSSPETMRLGGVRREVSIVFADICGFSAYSEQANPEDVVTRLNSYFKIATDVIFSREGTLDKFLGDAVMAFFNAPEEQADHAYRAVDTALALQRAVRERNVSAGGAGLQFSIGVHTGDAVAGNIGTEQAMNYTVIGDAVNVAKRLQEHAGPGEILITGTMYQQLGESIRAEFAGEVTVKNRQQPVQVYRLLGLL